MTWKELKASLVALALGPGHCTGQLARDRPTTEDGSDQMFRLIGCMHVQAVHAYAVRERWRLLLRHLQERTVPDRPTQPTKRQFCSPALYVHCSIGGR